jgi:hypothetical protein
LLTAKFAMTCRFGLVNATLPWRYLEVAAELGISEKQEGLWLILHRQTAHFSWRGRVDGSSDRRSRSRSRIKSGERIQ